MGKSRHIIFFSVSVLFISLSMDSYARSNKHIRVILDTSASMRGYTDNQGNYHQPQDPGKLSVLSVALLLDLALKDLHMTNNMQNSDSFYLIPFDRSYTEWQANSLPPQSHASPIKLVLGGNNRTIFIRKLKKLRRNGRLTYFYPGLKRATDMLKNTPNGLNDVRTIILITDGDSDNKTDDKVRLKELVEEMANSNITVDVLMFGAGANNIPFFKAIEKSSTNVTVSTFKSVQTADSLLAAMFEIFADRFGYQVGSLLDANSTSTLDLANNSNLSKAAVVNLVNKPQAPSFNLTAPHNKVLNEDPNILNLKLQGEEGLSGGGYSIHWITNPASGNYGYQLNSNLSNVKIAVLRPVEYIIQDDLTETPNSVSSIDSVMARGISKMFLKVETSTGGDPGHDIQIKYKAFSKDSDSKWDNDGEDGGAVVNMTPTFPGFYEIEAEFLEHPDANKRDKEYHATLETQAFTNGISVSQGGKKDLSITVYPYLKLKAWNKIIAVNGELKNGDQRCLKFKIKKVDGYWYERNKPGIRASLALSNNTANAQSNEFNRAIFTLNAQKVSFTQNTDIDVIYQTEDDYIITNNGNEDHEFCIKMGKPINVPQSSKVELILKLSLAQEPYNRYNSVINPVTFEMTIAEAHIKKWKFWLFLLPLLMIWYLRNIPKREDDLRYRLFSKNTQECSLQEFGLGSFFRTIFKLTQIHDIKNPANHVVIGHLIPVKNELYKVKFTGNLEIKNVLSNQLIHKNGGYWICVNQEYLLVDGTQEYIFRIEYE